MCASSPRESESRNTSTDPICTALLINIPMHSLKAPIMSGAGVDWMNGIMRIAEYSYKRQASPKVYGSRIGIYVSSSATVRPFV